MKINHRFEINPVEIELTSEIDSINIPLVKGSKFRFTQEQIFPITLSGWRSKLGKEATKNLTDYYEDRDSYNNTIFEIVDIKYMLHSDPNIDGHNSLTITYICKEYFTIKQRLLNFLLKIYIR